MGWIERRQFLLGVAALAVAQVVAAQPQGKIPRVGFITYKAPTNAQERAVRETFFQGLRDNGFEDGRNVAVEFRYVEGHPERNARFAAEFVPSKVDVIVAAGSSATRANVATERRVTMLLIEIVTVWRRIQCFSIPSTIQASRASHARRKQLTIGVPRAYRDSQRFRLHGLEGYPGDCTPRALRTERLLTITARQHNMPATRARPGYVAPSEHPEKSDVVFSSQSSPSGSRRTAYIQPAHCDAARWHIESPDFVAAWDARARIRLSA